MRNCRVTTIDTNTRLCVFLCENDEWKNSRDFTLYPLMKMYILFQVELALTIFGWARVCASVCFNILNSHSMRFFISPGWSRAKNSSLPLYIACTHIAHIHSPIPPSDRVIENAAPKRNTKNSLYCSFVGCAFSDEFWLPWIFQRKIQISFTCALFHVHTPKPSRFRRWGSK